MDKHASPILTFEQVSLYFEQKSGFFAPKKFLQAVNKVSFTLNRGECLGLVGESGCGKSTLGKLSCGLLQPSSGQVLFCGRELPVAGADSWAAGRIQMIFQDPYASLNPHLKICTSIAEPLAVQHFSKQEQRHKVEELLLAVGLPDSADRYPREFSGGQRQRIAIARALVTQPDLVICDEPVSALDLSVQAQILNLLRAMQERFKPAYLFISHDLSVVAFMCSHILVMYLGEIVEDIPREKLFQHATHPYTRALLASMPGGAQIRTQPELLQGELPSPLSPPTGCHFHPRCPYAMPICQQEQPPVQTLASDWRVRCHLTF